MRRALAMGAAVFAAVPVVVSPLSASADDSLTYEQWKSLYDYNISNPIVEEYFNTDPIWRFYFAATFALWEYVYIEGNTEIVPTDFKGYAGFYLKNGVRRFGSLYGDGLARAVSSTPVEGSFAPIALAALQDGTLSLELYPYDEVGTQSVEYSVTKTMSFGDAPFLRVYFDRTDRQRLHTNVLFPENGAFSRYGYSVTTAFSDAFWIYCSPTAEPQELTYTDSYIARSAGNGRILLANGGGFGQLPEDPSYPIITKSNVKDYINNVLNPWTVEQSPELEQYLWTATEEEDAPSPTYPVQETWAQEADWPEGNLLPTIPAASYTVEIPQIMTEGVSFWWRCLSVLFDGLGITAVVVGLLALGIVLYFVLR